MWRIACLAWIAVLPILAQVTALTHATLIDGSGKPAIADATLVISDGKIASIASSGELDLPAGSQAVDLRGKFIMPGIINLHGHVGLVKGLTTGAANYTRENIESQLHTYATYGVTSVVSAGHDTELMISIRDAQRRAKRFRGARVYTAGTGFSRSSGYPLAVAPEVRGFAFEVATPAEARSYVDKLAEMRVDLVKMWVDDYHDRIPKLTPEMWTAGIRRAHEHNLKAFAHLYDLEDAKGLVEAGIDVIAHSIRDKEVDQALLNAIKTSNVTVVATLTREQSLFVYASQPEWLDDPFFMRCTTPDVIQQVKSESFRQRQRDDPDRQVNLRAFENAMRNLKTLSDAGVRIGFGSDSGPAARFQGYFEHWEMELMAAAGMTPMQVIQSFSKNAAEALGVSEDFGTLEPGKAADLVVLDKNPLEDMTNTRAIHAVYIAGRRIQ